MSGGGPIQNGILSYGICSEEGILTSVYKFAVLFSFFALSSFSEHTCSTMIEASGLLASSYAVLEIDAS